MRDHTNGNGSYPNGYHNGEMREAMNGNGSHPDTHLARRMMVAYLTGACSSEEREAVEDHCVDCQTCCAQLAAMLHLIISSAHEREDKRRELEALLPIGEHAAARARKTVRRQEQWKSQRVSPWANLWKGLQVSRPGRRRITRRRSDRLHFLLAPIRGRTHARARARGLPRRSSSPGACDGRLYPPTICDDTRFRRFCRS